MNITLKHFILSTGIFILAYAAQFIFYSFGNHNWSRFGFKSSSNIYIFYYIYRGLYLLVWIVYLIKIFLEWYYNIKIK